MKYRPEIDGLRALAVIPVILYHTGFEFFKGGYLGVDVFFVISGYLITRIIIENLKSNNFSLLEFYQRRARRILPALIIVCVTFIPFSYIYLDPTSFADYGKSLISISVFASNIYFALSGGYFAEYVSTKPLLHTWSLSVEEQFYLVFPILIFLCVRFPRFKLSLVVTLLSILSIALTILLVKIYPRIAFFGLPTRAWELGIGVLIALLNWDFYISNRILGNVIGILGITILLLSYIFISAESFTFGIAVIPPVLGTALLIISPSSSLISKLISYKTLVSIGLISYSLYLWHQPVLSFGNQLPESIVTTISLLLLVIIISIFTWKYVEMPFRNRNLVKDRFILPISFMGLTFLGIAGWIISNSDGFVDRFPSYSNYKKSNTWTSEMNVDDACISKYGGDQYCLIYNIDKNVTDLLIGDSHANHFYIGLAERLSFLDKNLLMIGAGCCPPIIDIKMGFHYIHGRKLNCFVRVNEEYLSLLSNNNIDHIYLSFEQETMFDERIDFVDNRDEIDFSFNREDAVFSALMRTVNIAQNNNKSVSIIMDLPNSTHQDFINCLLLNKSENSCLNTWQPKDMNEKYLKLLKRLSNEGVKVIDTTFALNAFPLLGNGQYLFRDDSHLSLAGSHFVGSNMLLPYKSSVQQSK